MNWSIIKQLFVRSQTVGMIAFPSFELGRFVQFERDEKERRDRFYLKPTPESPHYVLFSLYMTFMCVAGRYWPLSLPFFYYLYNRVEKL